MAAARAVIFAQMVDDPSANPDLFPTAKKQERERMRLFGIIEELVKWENTTNEKVLEAARAEIWQSWRRACAENVDHPRAKELFDREVLPAFHDPFAGGGTLPLEAQRLGLKAYASDLNPVAVLINKAMIEIPPQFAGRPPVNADARSKNRLLAKDWRGAEGLADDVRYYGQLVRDEAEKRIGHLYPKVKVTPEIVKERKDLEPYEGRELTVIAWLWARTVKSPNPAFAQVDVPLASTFMLSTKKGKETYVEPVVQEGGYRFTVKVGKPRDAPSTKRGTKSGGSGSSFLCLMSGAPMQFEYLRAEAKAGRMGDRLLACVCEGLRGRIYLSPTPQMEAIARCATPTNPPDTDLPDRALGFRIQEYGMTKWRDLFTTRQLVALTTFSDLVAEGRERVRGDALVAGLSDNRKPLAEEGTSAAAYADALMVYLAFALDKTSEYGCTIVPWYAKEDRPKGLFARQAIPMVWDFAEVNPLGEIGGTFAASTRIVAGALEGCHADGTVATVEQCDAVTSKWASDCVVSTDPPYYDNIGYADLSDFFYPTFRRSRRGFSGILEGVTGRILTSVLPTGRGQVVANL